MITFVTWLWNGWRNVYRPEHVYRMREMIEQHYHSPHKFVCVTDNPARLEGVDTVRLWEENSFLSRKKFLPNCYRRLFLFHEDAKKVFGDNVVSIDLDAIILDDITPLFNNERFQVMRGYCNPYNGGLWQVRPGVCNEIWGQLSERKIRDVNRRTNFYGSDQAMMAYYLKKAPTWGPENGLYQYLHTGGRLSDNARILFFAGKVKPWGSQFASLYWGN